MAVLSALCAGPFPLVRTRSKKPRGFAKVLGYDRHSLQAIVPAFRRQGPLQQCMTYHDDGTPRGKKDRIRSRGWWPDGQPIEKCESLSDPPKEMSIPQALEVNVLCP